MKNVKIVPVESNAHVEELGRRIRVARQRRRLTIAELADKVGVDRNTLNALELGKPTVMIGTYVAALWVLGLEGTLAGVAAPDADLHGKALELARLPTKVRRAVAMADENDF